MKRILLNIAVGLIFCSAPLLSMAEDDRGAERMGSGVEGAVTSPAEIPKSMGEDMSERPVTGTVTGAAKGSAKTAGDAVEGGADIGVGAVEAVTDPLTGKGKE
jgi:hypothetical protein